MADDHSDRSNEVREEMRLIYQVSAENLRFAKQQSWMYANLAPVAQGALVLFSKELGDFPASEAHLWVLRMLALLAAALGLLTILLLAQTSTDQSKERSRQRDAAKSFTKPAGDIAVRKPASPPTSWVSILQVVAVVAATILVMGLLLSKSGVQPYWVGVWCLVVGIVLIVISLAYTGSASSSDCDLQQVR